MDALPVTNPTLPTEHANFRAVMVPFYKIADAFKKDDPTLPDYSFRTTPIIIKEADGWAGEYKRVFVELLLFLLLMPAEENANEVVELDGLAAGTAGFQDWKLRSTSANALESMAAKFFSSMIFAICMGHHLDLPRGHHDSPTFNCGFLLRFGFVGMTKKSGRNEITKHKAVKGEAVSTTADVRISLIKKMFESEGLKPETAAIFRATDVSPAHGANSQSFPAFNNSHMRNCMVPSTADFQEMFS
ncbi:hypothetical protein BY996DRAFT_6484795 [Phakopsora pachyrhizi]|nr:hypothetical protein BY996DRAFT_6484795 [Phakopsora pachyrhizi]